jgi:hypothetical protein
MVEWVHEVKRLIKVLTKLRVRVWKNGPELWKKKLWLLHQDNAPAHNALVVKQFLAHKCIHILQYTPYSPRFSPL